MNSQTLYRHTRLANDALYYIYRYIDTDVNIDALAHTLGVSTFHLHRVFAAEFGESLYQSIQSIRLQKASSLLLTNPHSTVSSIASQCGYSTQSAFLRAFKTRFSMTPTQWRQGGFERYSTKNLSGVDLTRSFEALEVDIVKMPELEAFYVRHTGYNRTIRSAWQKLQVWLMEHDLKPQYEIGLHHDNPLITPLDKCRYVAAVVVKAKPHTRIPNRFSIPEGIYARFSLTGHYGDVLAFLRWVYHVWLPQSGFETTTAPAYTIYRKNHFLNSDENFDLDFYLPVRYSK